MKPISLSIIESIPMPQAAEGPSVRPLAERQIANSFEKDDRDLSQPLPKPKSVSRKQVNPNEPPASNEEKEEAPNDRMTFGEFLQTQQPQQEVTPEPETVTVPITSQIPEPVIVNSGPTVSKAAEVAAPQSVALPQAKRPVLQNVIATAQAKPEQTISPVQFPGLPDSFAKEIEPQIPVQPITPTKSEALPNELELLHVTEISAQVSETPPLLESVEPIAFNSLFTPQPVPKQPTAKISVAPTPITNEQLPAAPLEVIQQLPTGNLKPVSEEMPIDLGLPEVAEPKSTQPLKPVAPVVFDLPTKLTAYTYRAEKVLVKTGEPEFTVAPQEQKIEAPDARISSILKKLIQENPTDSLLPAVSNDMPMAEPNLAPTPPFNIDPKLTQSTPVFDSEPIQLNPRVDSTVASQVVAQISDQLSLDDVKIGQKSTREITIQIKPQELGAIKILVETTDGRLFARIEASELITSEMLIKEKGQLLSALKERGLDVPDLDISYRDPESQNSHRQDQHEPDQRFDFRNERQGYKNQARFDSQETSAVKTPPSKRFVINVIA